MPESAAVRQLHPETPPEKNIATAVSIVVGVADDRQITFQSGYEGDESDEAIFARLQRTMGFADRLKAVYEIPKLEAEIAEHETNYARLEEDWGAAEQRYEHDQAVRQVTLDELEAKSRSAWQTSGRRGDYKPVGATAAAIDNTKKSIATAKAERDQQLELNAKTRERWTQELETRKDKLAKARKTAEG